jgi:hypothetical protein
MSDLVWISWILEALSMWKYEVWSKYFRFALFQYNGICMTLHALPFEVVPLQLCTVRPALALLLQIFA